MKVLAIIANANIREMFKTYFECEVRFLSPHTSNIEDAKALINSEGFDFIIFDFHAPISAHVRRLIRYRSEIPDVPLLTFSLYHLPVLFAECGEVYDEERYPFYNQVAINPWTKEGEETIRRLVANAQRHPVSS